MRSLSSTLQLIRCFGQNTRGNVAIIFTLSIIPMIGLLGLAADYSMALRTKSALDSAADAASLAAITTASNVMKTQTPSYDPTTLAISEGQAQGQRVFSANAGRFASAAAVANTTLSVNGVNLSSTTTYTAHSPNTFGSMFGTPVMNIRGTASSTLAISKYINIYLLVDVSQSMGIASSQTDMNTLYAATSAIQNQEGCVFGCHVVANGQTSGRTNEEIAHSIGVSLRIDVIKSAIANMIDKAQASAGTQPRISIGLYTMEVDMHTIASPSTSYAALRNQNQAIDLGSETNSAGYGDTYPWTSITDLAGLLGSSGDGSSAGNAINYVFIMTDGTTDTRNPACVFGHCVTAYDPAFCAQLKTKATVGVIYTTYLPIYLNNNPAQGLDNRYAGLVSPIASQISPKLQGCASASNWFIEASDGPSINSALNTLFAQASTMAHLTQ